MHWHTIAQQGDDVFRLLFPALLSPNDAKQVAAHLIARFADLIRVRAASIPYSLMLIRRRAACSPSVYVICQPDSTKLSRNASVLLHILLTAWETITDTISSISFLDDHFFQLIFRRNKSPPIVPNSLTVATLGSRLGCCCNSPFPFVCAQLQCTSIQSDEFQQLIASFSRMQSSALLCIYIFN
jgi:hypothetical protein